MSMEQATDTSEKECDITLNREWCKEQVDRLCAWEILRRYVLHETSVAMTCLLYTSPSPRDGLLSRMPSSA